MLGSRRIVSGYAVARSRAAVVTTVVTTATRGMGASVVATPGRGPVVTSGRLGRSYVVELVTGVVRARRLVWVCVDDWWGLGG